jgi:hypothetical protein
VATWNDIAGAIFDPLLAPFGHDPAWFDLLLWPVLAGILALVSYKYVSNQKGIERTKERIKVGLYEMRLFRHDPLVVLASTAKILFRNVVYVAHNLLPMAVVLLPMLAVLTQLEANYAFAPAPVGTVELLKLELDPKSAVAPRDVTLELPDGVALDAPPVRTADGEVFWRLRAEREGDHVMQIRVGGETIEKRWAVGGANRKVPVMRAKGLDAFLYPGEPALAASSPARKIALAYPERDLGWLPGGELGVLATFFGVSLLAGFALKGRFGVTF